MKHLQHALLLLLTVTVLVGCETRYDTASRSDSPPGASASRTHDLDVDAFFQEYFAVLDEYMDVLRSIKDEDTAKAAAGKAHSLETQKRQMQQKLDELKRQKDQLSPEEQKRLEHKLMGELTGRLQEYAEESKRLQQMPEASYAFTKEMQRLGETGAAVGRPPASLEEPESKYPERQWDILYYVAPNHPRELAMPRVPPPTIIGTMDEMQAKLNAWSAPVEPHVSPQRDVSRRRIMELFGKPDSVVKDAEKEYYCGARGGKEIWRVVRGEVWNYEPSLTLMLQDDKVAHMWMKGSVALEDLDGGGVGASFMGKIQGPASFSRPIVTEEKVAVVAVNNTSERLNLTLVAGGLKTVNGLQPRDKTTLFLRPLEEYQVACRTQEQTRPQVFGMSKKTCSLLIPENWGFSMGEDTISRPRIEWQRTRDEGLQSVEIEQAARVLATNGGNLELTLRLCRDGFELEDRLQPGESTEFWLRPEMYGILYGSLKSLRTARAAVAESGLVLGELALEGSQTWSFSLEDDSGASPWELERRMEEKAKPKMADQGPRASLEPPELVRVIATNSSRLGCAFRLSRGSGTFDIELPAGKSLTLLLKPGEYLYKVRNRDGSFVGPREDSKLVLQKCETWTFLSKRLSTRAIMYEWQLERHTYNSASPMPDSEALEKAIAPLPEPSQRVKPEPVTETTDDRRPEPRPDAKVLVEEGQESTKLRTWTDSTGEFKVEAEFISYAMGTVKLRKNDGEEISIRMDKLSEVDQEWIRKRWSMLLRANDE